MKPRPGPLAAALLFGCLLGTAAAAAAETPVSAALPADSIYQLDAGFSDQDGHRFSLRERRGRPQLAALFYTSCRYVCPLIIDSAKGVEKALDAPQREQLQFLIVSLDPARDDAAALRRVADKRQLDTTRWTLARTDSQNVRRFAALLDIRYRELADGEFNHTSALVLLDGEGRRIARTEKLGGSADMEFVDAVKAVLGGATQ